MVKDALIDGGSGLKIARNSNDPPGAFPHRDSKPIAATTTQSNHG
jgi:hypothetical protein